MINTRFRYCFYKICMTICIDSIIKSPKNIFLMFLITFDDQLLSNLFELDITICLYKLYNMTICLLLPYNKFTVINKNKQCRLVSLFVLFVC